MSESGTTSTVGISTTSFPAPANAVVIAAGANIQDAVNDYPPGTAFLLSAGTYSGQTITPLNGDSFYGQPGTVLDGGGLQQAFQGQGISDVTISGLTITNYAPDANGTGTLGTDGSSVNWIVQGCTFTQTSAGVPIMLGTGMTVRDCSIYDNQTAGIGGSDIAGATIENNDIYANNQSLQNPFQTNGSNAGIKIGQCTNVQILNNDISNNLGAPGIWTDSGCSGTLIDGNTISGNGGPGIIDERDYGATITNNLIENNNSSTLAGSNGGGIYIKNAANANVSGNTLNGNVGGIWLHQSSRGGSGRQGAWVVNNDVISNNVIQMAAGNSGYDSSVNASDVNFYGNSYYLSGSAQLVAGGSAVSSAQWQADGNDTTANFGAGSTVPVSVPSPTAVADTATTEENQAVTIGVLSVDTDPGGTLDPGSVAISTAPTDGTVTVSPTTGDITYTPAAGFYGTDSFQYSVADISGSRSTPGTVSVTVNQPPVAAASTDLAPAVSAPANDPTTTTNFVATGAAQVTGNALTTQTQLAAFTGFPNEWLASETATTLAQWNSLVAAMGQTPTMMLTYINYQDPLSSWVTNDTEWEINSFAQGPWGPGQITPVVAIPMALAGDNADSDFQAIASGQWDSTLNGIFQAWANAGYKTLDIRPGHEMNGNWYPWSITSQNVADYVTAFQHIAALAHSFSGLTINVVWSPNNGVASNGAIPVASYYPGNAAVDVISIDEYGPPLGGDSLPNAVPTSSADYTLSTALAMAKADNKPFALAETGAMDTGFPAALASAVAAAGVQTAFVALWDYNSGTQNFDFSDTPSLAAAWKQAYATISNSSAPAGPPPDPNSFTVTAAQPISLKAGTAFSGTIASFSDSDTATSASSLNAKIVWGDGTTSTGTVTDVNGAISVAGTHTYAAAGTDAISVTLTDTGGTASATAKITATVAPAGDPNVFTVTSAQPISLKAGTAFSGTIASFSDSDTATSASSLNATIVWGDGTTSTGTVTDVNGAISVAGTHTYAAAGTDAISVTLKDTGGTASATAKITATVAQPVDPNVFTVTSAQPISLKAGTAFSGTLATFTDSDTATSASSLNATIVWGDGTTSTGTVTDVNGAISVAGTHTYAAAGTDAVSVTLKDTGGTASATAKITATVGPPPDPNVFTVATAPTISAKAGTAYSSTIATFTDSDTATSASSLNATIVWGDGTTSTGTVTDVNGAISVAGTHTYAAAGTDAVSVTLKDIGGTASATANTTANVGSGVSTPPPDPNVFTVATAPTISAKAGTAYSSTIATFTDSDTATSASSLSASISWGDGTTSTGTVTDVNGAISVAGTHTYAAAGTDAVSVTLKDIGGTASATANTTANVGSGVSTPPPDPNVFTVATAPTISAKAGTAYSSTIATFTDSDTATSASSLSASISWGDGTTSVGTVTDVNGAISVAGSHTYAAAGTDAVSVTLTDIGGTASATANTTANVGSGVSTPPPDPNVFTVGTAPTISATANTAFSGTIATFTDSDTATPASSLSATIVWGDGTTSTGSVTDVNGAISVAGTHTYAAAGTDPVSVTLKDVGGTASATANTTANVAAQSGGAPQLPGLFSGYAVRPPWSVAGVDYPVGVPGSTVLANPNGISMQGVTVNAAAHIINVTGNNVTLNGYDFSLNGGWSVNVTGANDVIENSNFAVGANELVPITAGASSTNLSVLHNTIDGGGSAGTPSAISALINDTGTGLTVEYNWLKNAPNFVVEFKNGTLTDEYNLVQNDGNGGSTYATDVAFNGGVSNGSVISFNTFYDAPNSHSSNAQGSAVQIESQNGATVTNTQFENNTIISPPSSRTNTYPIAIHQDLGTTFNGVNVEDNYLSTSGAHHSSFSTNASNVAFVNNQSLTTGSVLPGARGIMSGNLSSVAVTSGNGTATAGTTVTIAVNLNEAVTVSGVPTLSLNDGGTAIFTGGSGTNTLNFSTTIGTSNSAVSALAITGINLPAGSVIVDAAGNAANLSGITRGLHGAPAVAPGSAPAGSSTTTITSSDPVNPTGTTSGSGTSSSGVIGIPSSSGFISPPTNSGSSDGTSGSGSDPTAGGGCDKHWLWVTMHDQGAGLRQDPNFPTGLNWHADWSDHSDSSGSIVSATGSDGTTLPSFSSVCAAAHHAGAGQA